MILTNTKSLIAIVAMFALVFAGVAVADTADADPEPVAPAVSYSVVYDVDGMLYTKTNGTSNVVTLETLDALGASPKAGMTFTNWALPDGTAYAAGSTYIIPAPTDGSASVSVTFAAVCDYTEYTAVFKSYNGSVLGAPITGTVQDGHVVSLSEAAAAFDVAREGYIFAGWMAEGASEPVKTADLPELRGNVVYTAAYTVDYVISFVDGDKTLSSHVSDVRMPAEAVREGFVFLGWFIGTEQIADPVAYSATVTEDTTFTAHWEPINVYVTFMIGGDVFALVPVLYGETVVMPAVPEGYSGWDFDFDTAITADVTVYAVPEAPAAPSGLSDPVTMTMAIVGAILVASLIAVFATQVKKGKIVIGRGPNAKKKTEENDKP